MHKHTLTQQCCHKHCVTYYNPHSSSLSSIPAVHSPTRCPRTYTTSQLLAAYQLPPRYCVTYLKSRPAAAPSFLANFSLPPSPPNLFQLYSKQLYSKQLYPNPRKTEFCASSYLNSLRCGNHCLTT